MNNIRLKHDITYSLGHDDINRVLGYSIPAHTYPSLKKFSDINDLFVDPITGTEYDACMILYQSNHMGRAANPKSSYGHWTCLTRTPINVNNAKIELKGSGLCNNSKKEIINSIKRDIQNNEPAVCLNFYDPYGMYIDNQLNKIPKQYRRQTGQTRKILTDLIDNSNYELINFNPYHHQSYSVRLPNGQKTITTVCGRHCSNFIKSGMTPEIYNKYLKNMRKACNAPNYDILITELVPLE